MNKIIIMTKGNPFRAGSGRERAWDLLTVCQTDLAFKNRFAKLPPLRDSLTAENFLAWAVRDGHIKLVPAK
jgi:hypothetical protein